MSVIRVLLASALLTASSQAVLAAEKGNVVVSIKPIHSLVSAVMQGAGEPELIVKGAASEHGYSLKPSDAGALAKAKVIFWVGPEMETYLTKPLESLGAKAEIVRLDQVKGLEILSAREGGNFEAHDHGHGSHGDSHSHEGEAEAHDHHHDDMHIWLDPQNAKLMLEPIAAALAKADPVHAEQYKKNATAYADKIDALQKEISTELEPVRTKPYIVFHDAYQYFERRFDLASAGSITVNPEKAPGAARIREIQTKVKSLGATCVFSEPQFESALVKTVLEGTQAKTGVLDPLGAELQDGPELYPQLIRNLATSLKICLQ
ncbi:zinc ABC transporter substrate-binding protein ZnuA [Pseudochrobactrum kiredjianiae]|uniref:High-affinity zinc uptake system protein ZnuA n=1 Tax=Pseudochrobactrum kiredjianiae TaxID=386305 RepID=A0ABW3V5S2_9HYPH|nr:zinc ABC transporter substrate-binding protein ZnuA [Pseudochrobactrum kiredjianiae]MDM7852945.1 zinc ABC transporter substrate-binding protein ZnuA [Pseudochrobactrum kiredjianiae]